MLATFAVATARFKSSEARIIAKQLTAVHGAPRATQMRQADVQITLIA